jgi:transcriptional regulator with XRE-family HTH domain
VSHVSSLFRRRRVDRGLSIGQLARLLGYRNVSKGCNRIQGFEGGGKVAPDLLARLASELAITPDEIRHALGEDYRDWLAWANQPVRPHVVLRYLACVYQRIELPDDALDPEAAELFASDLARERRFKVCLVLSRRISVWYDATGREYARTEATPEMPCEPYAVIGGKRVQFDFGGSNVLRQIDEPGP